MAEEFQNLYIDYSYKNQNHLLFGDGPLPFAERHYIALMGAIVRRHAGLVKYNADNFLIGGGNPAWLTNLESIPLKIQKLREINEILATDPWLLTPAHISRLLRNPGIWSLTELMQAILILINVHSLSRFIAVYDRLKIEKCCDVRSCCPPQTNSSSATSSDYLETNSSTNKDTEFCIINFSLFSSRCQDVVSDGFTNCLITSSLTPSNLEVLSFLEDLSMTYHQFRERLTGHKGTFFHIHDYSWQDHGYSLVNRLFMEFGISLDEEFTVIRKASAVLCPIGDAESAAAYTRAVWNYVFLQFGIHLEDYHRNEVNQRLSPEVKAFIKLVTVFPERLHHPMFSRFSKNLKHFERRHLNVLVQEAQFQVDLLYSLRVLSRLT